MKQLLISLLLTICCLSFIAAQSPVRLVINSGASDMMLKTTVEKNVSMLMTDLNNAYKNNLTVLLFPKDQVTVEAQQELNMLWANEHFRCSEEEIVERLLTTHDGYQVRGIPLSVKRPDNPMLEYQEAVINFDRKGVITGVRYAVHQWKDIVNETREVTEISERMMILDYVEHFRTAYNQKDLTFLNQVFSNDALIITGRVIRVSKTELEPTGKRIVYRKQDKAQYLEGLRKVFKNNGYVKVSFDDIKIVKHPDPKKENIYGVTVRQRWNSSSYSDEGYVFMVWDFRHPDEPQIHVRTWQPEYVDKTHQQKLNPNDVFTLGDFDL